MEHGEFLEILDPGREGYRFRIIDYDASTETLYKPQEMRYGLDVFDRQKDAVLLSSPGMSMQSPWAPGRCSNNALDRRVCWGFDSSQLQISPHPLAVANAFYSRQEQSAVVWLHGRSHADSVVYESW